MVLHVRARLPDLPDRLRAGRDRPAAGEQLGVHRHHAGPQAQPADEYAHGRRDPGPRPGGPVQDQRGGQPQHGGAEHEQVPGHGQQHRIQNRAERHQEHEQERRLQPDRPPVGGLERVPSARRADVPLCAGHQRAGA